LRDDFLDVLGNQTDDQVDDPLLAAAVAIAPIAPDFTAITVLAAVSVALAPVLVAASVAATATHLGGTPQHDLVLALDDTSDALDYQAHRGVDHPLLLERIAAGPAVAPVAAATTAATAAAAPIFMAMRITVVALADVALDALEAFREVAFLDFAHESFPLRGPPGPARIGGIAGNQSASAGLAETHAPEITTFRDSARKYKAEGDRRASQSRPVVYI
jgi:hypothetical protein